MTSEFHSSGALQPSERIVRQLVRCRVIEEITSEPTLPLERVRRIEGRIGQRLPDDVLCIAASGTELFCANRKMTLETVEEYSQKPQSTTDDDYIPIGFQPDEQKIFAIRRNDEPPLFIWELRPAKNIQIPHDLGNWLEWRINDFAEKLLMTGDETSQQRAGRMPGPKAFSAFSPRLID